SFNRNRTQIPQSRRSMQPDATTKLLRPRAASERRANRLGWAHWMRWGSNHACSGPVISSQIRAKSLTRNELPPVIACFTAESHRGHRNDTYPVARRRRLRPGDETVFVWERSVGGLGGAWFSLRPWAEGCSGLTALGSGSRAD